MEKTHSYHGIFCVFLILNFGLYMEDFVFYGFDDLIKGLIHAR